MDTVEHPTDGVGAELALVPDWLRDRLVPDEAGCLIWHGSKNGARYGVVKFGHWTLMVSGLVYRAVNGLLTPGNLVLHSCDKPSCARPSHLREGTAADNARDSVERGRHWKVRKRLARQRTPL